VWRLPLHLLLTLLLLQQRLALLLLHLLTRRESTESPSRHWHYLHHLHGSLWHG
jgi:hypothetical protein